MTIRTKLYMYMYTLTKPTNLHTSISIGLKMCICLSSYSTSGVNISGYIAYRSPHTKTSVKWKNVCPRPIKGATKIRPSVEMFPCRYR